MAGYGNPAGKALKAESGGTVIVQIQNPQPSIR